ncbi:MAG: CocE/NonD family hydrolase [Pseudomonadales bacterium]|nr:CocE/NonD family hydrolase [Pseudomonadales bacterium]
MSQGFQSIGRSLVLSFCVVLVSACSTLDVKTHYAQYSPQQGLEADYYQIDIETHDGLTLRATLYQPQLAPGETAPVVIHAHGFGVFRMSRPLSLYGQLLLSGEAALETWKQKYWLISFDQRGFGDSDGKVNIMDVNKEVKDVSTIVSWVEDNLPRVSRDQSGDLVVGMIGESYGGGAQLLASIFDDRIDAIVPITTWNDLNDALAPNGHVRTAWGGFLLGGGILGSLFDFDKAFASPYTDLFNGKLNVAAAMELEKRSPAMYCAEGKYPQADMLLIQGFRDTVFPVNHAYKNWLCGKQGGVDARLVAIQGGHILPWPMQSWSGMPFYNTEAVVRCGSYEEETISMVVNFFDEKLKNKVPSQKIPSICLTAPNGDGLVADDVPQHGIQLNLADSELDLIHSGWFEVLLQPMDSLFSLFWRRTNQTSDLSELTGGTMRPAFKPLLQITHSSQLLGIPKLNINLRTTDEDKESTVFVGVGLRRNGSYKVELVSEQLMPLPGDGHYEIALSAVSTTVEPGDQVGLLMQGFSGQFFFNPDGWFESAHLAGSVELPLTNSPHGFSIADN